MIHPTHLPDAPRRIFIRRLTLGVLAVASTAIATYGTWLVLAANEFHPLEWPVLPLFVALVFPITLSFWTAVFGFCVQLKGGDPLSLRANAASGGTPDVEIGILPRGGASARDDDSKGAGAGGVLSAGQDARLHGRQDACRYGEVVRAAIVVPAYNEDTVRLFAGLKATYESVERSGHLSAFDFFLLSDTTDPDAWIREEMALHDLRDEVSDPSRLFYRNRRDNIERKAGNIADFCAIWGKQYRYMIVFDADSLMTGESLVNLVRLMEAHPEVGILQTPPVAVNRQSLFGRLLQFSTHAYGPTFISGLNFWQAGEANYWGHNAIIRVQPFVEHCRLPKLSGKEPLGGSILSHDFVEAALMRRAGWKVYVANELGGSYEEIPANLIGHAARDRRWCQGNLQHARLLTMPGLNWINRVHLAMGVMSYAASPLWMLMLLLATGVSLQTAFFGHSYFQPDQSQFPVWQVSLAGKAALLLTSVLAMLLLPKCLSLISWLTIKRKAVAGFGGPWKLTASVVGETLFSVVLAPVLAMLHSRFVIATLLGRKVEWAPQDRGDVETPWRSALRWHLSITALGIVWAVLLWWNDRALFWWLSPVLAGWLLAIPVSSWTSRRRAGQWARNHGLFLTPEEVSPPLILKRFHEILKTAATQPWAIARDGLNWVLTDPQARAIHLSMLPPKTEPNSPLTQHRLDGLRLKVHSVGEGALLPGEKRELLWDAETIERLSRERASAPTASVSQ